MLCVASSRIAAMLLKGGQTAHSTFKIPLDIRAKSLCNVKNNSHLGSFIHQVALIIWDKVPMQHCYCAKAVDHMLQDKRKNHNSDLPFGGIPVVFRGNFQQIVPVIPHRTRADIGQAYQWSYFWHKMTVLHLKENMRLGQNAANREYREYASWLQRVGKGTTYPGRRVPASHSPQYVLDRTILLCHNTAAVVMMLMRSLTY